MNTITHISNIGIPAGLERKSEKEKLIQEIARQLPANISLQAGLTDQANGTSWWVRFQALIKAQVWWVMDMQEGWWVPWLQLVLGKKVILYMDRPPLAVRAKRASRWQREKETWMLRIASQVITAHEAISDALLQHYGISSQVAGWGLPALAGHETTPANLPLPQREKSYVLGLAELDNPHALETVLQAFAQYPRFDLVLVGKWSRHRQGQQLQHRYSGYQNIHLLELPDDPETWQALKRRAYLFLQLHTQKSQQLHELIEAMQLGLPVLSLDTPFNRELTYHRALYYRHLGELVSLLEVNNRHRLQLIGQDLAQQARKYQGWQRMAEVCLLTFASLQSDTDAAPLHGLSGISARLRASIDQPDQCQEPA